MSIFNTMTRSYNRVGSTVNKVRAINSAARGAETSVRAAALNKSVGVAFGRHRYAAGALAGAAIGSQTEQRGHFSAKGALAGAGLGMGGTWALKNRKYMGDLAQGAASRVMHHGVPPPGPGMSHAGIWRG